MRTVVLGSAFTLFQITVHRCLSPSMFSMDPEMLLDLPLYFAVFSLGLVASARYRARWPLALRWAPLASGLLVLIAPVFLGHDVSLSSPAASFVGAFGVFSFAAITLPCFFLGVAAGLEAEMDGISFAAAMALGAALAIVAHHFVIGYFSFETAFIVTAALPAAVSSAGVRGWALALVAALALMAQGRPDRSIERYYTPYGLTEVFADPRGGFFIKTDKANKTSIARKGDISAVQPQARLPYRFVRPRRVLVLGAGGGQDVVAALYHGARRVTAVEIDPLRAALMKDRFGVESNGLYSDPRVQLIVDEGRHAVRRLEGPLDLIVIQRPWASQYHDGLLFDISQSLWTPEALRRYWRLLSPDGVLYICLGIRWDRAHEILLQNLSDAFPKALLRTHARALLLDRGFLVGILAKRAWTPAMLAAIADRGTRIMEVDEAVRSLPLPTARPEISLARARPRAYYQYRYLVAVLGLPALLLLALIPVAAAAISPSTVRVARGAYASLGVFYFALEGWLLLYGCEWLGRPWFVYAIGIPAFILAGGAGYMRARQLDDLQAIQWPALGFIALLEVVRLLDPAHNIVLPSAAEIAALAALSGACGYLCAFPFGCLIRGEPEPLIAYAWDALGSMACYPLLIAWLERFDLDALTALLQVCAGVIALVLPRVAMSVAEPRRPLVESWHGRPVRSRS